MLAMQRLCITNKQIRLVLAQVLLTLEPGLLDLERANRGVLMLLRRRHRAYDVENPDVTGDSGGPNVASIERGRKVT